MELIANINFCSAIHCDTLPSSHHATNNHLVEQQGKPVYEEKEFKYLKIKIAPR